MVAVAAASVAALVAVALARRSEHAVPKGPGASAVASPVAAAVRPPDPVLRALTTDSAGDFQQRSWVPFSVSDDTGRITYVGNDVGTYRVHDLRTDGDEVIPSPDGTHVQTAMFAGQGPAERIVVQTRRATWSVDPVTKQATKIVDDPLNYVSMSADGHYFEWLRSDSKRKIGVFGRTDTTTGVATDLGEIPDKGDAPLFLLSPDGSLLASSPGDMPSRLELARSDAPLDVHPIIVDDRLRVDFDSISFAWLGDDRIVVALQKGSSDHQPVPNPGRPRRAPGPGASRAADALGPGHRASCSCPSCAALNQLRPVRAAERREHRQPRACDAAPLGAAPPHHIGQPISDRASGPPTVAICSSCPITRVAGGSTSAASPTLPSSAPSSPVRSPPAGRSWLSATRPCTGACRPTRHPR